MGMTIVRRRVVGYVKKTRKPHVPLPRKRDTDEMVGERAKPFRPLAAFVSKKPDRDGWWRRAWKPAALLAGIVAGAALIYSLAGSLHPASSSDRSVARVSAPAPSSSLRNNSKAVAYPNDQAGVVEVQLSNRALPTDESFLATAYVRRKVSLPNISGNCVVTGDGSRSIGECLRQQEASANQDKRVR